MTESLPFRSLVEQLARRQVRYALIGVGGVNYYALQGALMFTTKDKDLFLPPEPDNLVRAWEACEAAGLQLKSQEEPLDQPHDRWLAERVVANHALTRAEDGEDLYIDLTLVMAGFGFEEVWGNRRAFRLGGHEIHVAALRDILRSKELAGRDKDILFLATHRDALEQHYGLGRYTQPPIGPRPPGMVAS